MDDALFSTLIERLYDELQTRSFDKDYELVYDVDEKNIQIPEHNISNLGNKNLIFFNMASYMHDILKSYNFDSDEIWKQCKLDFPRTNVFVELSDHRQISIVTKQTDPNYTYQTSKQQSNVTTHELSDPTELFDHFASILDLNYCLVDDEKYTLQTVLTLMCNQSSYGFPFYYLHTIFSDYPNQKMLSSMDDNRATIFRYDRKYLQIEITGQFCVKDLKTGDNETRINFKLVLDTDLGAKYLFPTFGLFFWEIV